MITRVLTVLCAIVPCGVAVGGTFDSGSDGSDGALVIAGDTVIDLGAAVPGPWDMPGTGVGVYDPDLWVVVFKYTTIDIVSGTVTFLNHPSGAPVVWLAQGDVFIGGTVSLNGEAGALGAPFQYRQPGPGGFSGGAVASGNFAYSSGFGPGGGAPCGGTGSGSHAGTGASANPNPGQTYGTAAIQPFIGGSGASGKLTSIGPARGGAGGGAILIASSGVIELTGAILARGGGGLDSGFGNNGIGGSGGAIRLIANEILGSGSLSAIGVQTNPGGTGRIRLEAVTLANFTGSANPNFFFSGPGPVFPAGAPVLRATMIGGFPIPDDPDAGVTTVDVNVNQVSVTLEIEAMNIPPGTTVRVYVRPAHGAACFFDSPPLVDVGGGWSMTSIDLDLPEIQTEIQLKANF